ncbi:hypothetical protein [Flavobacterium gawalongense]|uniref:Lipoprotein n=1 Tax=Flavobacterium gawalongense TaxID=2594432 RepID=A0A553BBE7_9FLAO|nr:hypothetical protein [Flavobacterium gawalongense]TRX01355.1 hypothetical protein FNW33_09590 [Flavobacterium gawalongense]TRX05572.1 hypothetical protein FNW11_15940 [Flavobacterium gawalongense]TRX05879.1 hypothetical protein FNW12_09675 [Flavobacterium gawalongense]TRX06413.1 hypothetical protein FNW10_15995 [Flavobacterium gawalongense]TRX22335.1 hypothetical protein FNW38_16030 [Flavobacterium gawalongense]
MKNVLYILVIVFTTSFLLISCGEEKTKKKQKPSNYTVVLDLSDRILLPEQLDKDFYLIEKYFKAFEENSRHNLVLTSKNRFSVKIIPQKNSPLAADHYEDLLQLYLDETEVKDKNKSLLALSQSLPKVLKALKKEALFGKTSSNYFGVDIWAFLHDNGMGLSKFGYDNTVLVLTDGYFDFESQTHVIKEKNQYTSTHFLNELTATDWKQISETKEYGLLPIKLEKNTKWIVAGFSGKKANDILQTEKITYFWKKWLTQSGVAVSQFILNSSKTEMSSNLLEQLR